MLKLKVNDGETEVVLELEHSLRSLSKWEQKHKKSWWATQVKSHEEMIEYYQYMVQDTKTDVTLVYRLSPEQLDEISNYINDTATASVVPPADSKKQTGDVLTTELIYAWLTMLEIDWEAQDWHLNRLMMLVSIVQYKRQPEKPVEKRRLLQTWHEVQARNKEKFGIQG